MAFEAFDPASSDATQTAPVQRPSVTTGPTHDDLTMRQVSPADHIDSMSSSELEAYQQKMLAEAGISDEQVNKQKQEQLKETRAQLQADFQKNKPNATIHGAIEGTLGVVEGVGLSTRHFYQVAENNVAATFDEFKNYAASKGVPIPLGSIPKVEVSEQEAQTDAGKIAQKITDYVYPVVVAMAAGGAAGLTGAQQLLADGLVGAVSSTPTTQNLTSHLENTPLAELPVVGNVIKVLGTRSDDPQWARNLKMGAEIGILGAATHAVSGLIGIAWAATKARKAAEIIANPQAEEAATKALQEMAPPGGPKPVEGIPSVNNVAEKAAPAGAAEIQVTNIPPETPAAKAATEVAAEQNAPLQEAKLSAQAATEPTPLVIPPEKDPTTMPEWIDYLKNNETRYEPTSNNTPEELAQLEKDIATMGIENKIVEPPVEGQSGPRVVLSNHPDRMQFWEKLTKIYSPEELAHVSLTDSEVALGTKTLLEDPEFYNRINTWHPSQGPLSRADAVAARVFSRGVDNDLSMSRNILAANPKDPAANINFARTLESWMRAQAIAKGTASAAGAALHAEQILATAAGVGDRTALQAMGAKGRAQLSMDLINHYGGMQALQDGAKKLELLQSLADVEAISNRKAMSGSYQVINGDLVDMYSLTNRPLTAITSTVAKWLLSPQSFAKAAVGGAYNTFGDVVANYAGAAVRLNWEAIQLANIRTSATFRSFFAGFKNAAATMINPDEYAGHYLLHDEDFFPLGKAFDSEDAARRGLGNFAQVRGMATQALKTGVPKAIFEGAGFRTTLSADAFWGTVNMHAAIEEAGMKEAFGLVREGKLKSGDISDFMDTYRQKPPYPVLQEAMAAAQNNTLTSELTGNLNAVNKGIAAVTDISTGNVGLGRLIAPFTRITFNSIRTAAEVNPLTALFCKNVQADLLAGGQRAATRTVKLMTGTTALAGMTWAASENMIRGSRLMDDPSDSALRDIPETSIKIGDHWVQVGAIPQLAFLVNAGYAMHKASSQSSDVLDEAAHAFTYMLGETVDDASQLTNSMALLAKSFFYGPEQGQSAKQYFSSVATEFLPLSGTLRFARRLYDPVTRNTNYENFMDAVVAKLKNSVPGLDKDLPPIRDIFGNKVSPPGVFVSSELSPIPGQNKETSALNNNFNKISDFAQARKGTDSGLYQLGLQMPSYNLPIPGQPGNSLRLTPQQYSDGLIAFGGRNPDTGELFGAKPLQQEISDVFKKYKFDDKQPREMDPKEYSSMLSEVKGLIVKGNGYRSSYLLGQKDIQQIWQQKAAQGAQEQASPFASPFQGGDQNGSPFL